MIRVLLIVIGYLFGLFQTGWFYGKKVGKDLKKYGSGNTGATNALRVLGLKGGLIVFIGDALKAFIPCLAVRLIFKDQGALAYAYMAYTALGVQLGNNYPCYLKFNGGKGVSALSGTGLAWSWIVWIGCMSFFFILAFATRYVSLASVLTCILLIGVAFLFGRLSFGAAAVFSPAAVEFYVVMTLIFVLVIIRHRANIKRLINGTENRFGKKK